MTEGPDHECLVLQDSFGRNGLGLSLGFSHGSHHSAGAAAAEEEIVAIGFKARYANALWHLDQKSAPALLALMRLLRASSGFRTGRSTVSR